jgi:hypothetical protein
VQDKHSASVTGHQTCDDDSSECVAKLDNGNKGRARIVPLSLSLERLAGAVPPDSLSLDLTWPVKGWNGVRVHPNQLTRHSCSCNTRDYTAPLAGERGQRQSEAGERTRVFASYDVLMKCAWERPSRRACRDRGSPWTRRSCCWREEAQW